jgi:hypothetical protein
MFFFASFDKLSHTFLTLSRRVMDFLHRHWDTYISLSTAVNTYLAHEKHALNLSHFHVIMSDLHRH